MLSKHIGQQKMDNQMDIKENIYILMCRNGKTKCLGGVVPFKEMFKSTLKRLIPSHPNYLTQMDRLDQLLRK